MNNSSKKRSRSRSPPPWQRKVKSPRQHYDSSRDLRNDRRTDQRTGGGGGRDRNVLPREYARRNQDQENAQMQEWVSKEDEFVLKQSKKKAKIRVRDGRAKPIDWLVVVLTVTDDERDLLADDDDESEVDVVDPEVVIEEVPPDDLHEMEREIDHYIILEKDDTNCVYWKALKTVCKSRRQQLTASESRGRGIGSISEDVEKLLGPKSLDQLRGLERAVNDKLQSNEPIDEEYWEQLLDNIEVYKAKAHLKEFYRVVVESRLRKLKRQQIEEARSLQQEMSSDKNGETTKGEAHSHAELDPDPMLKLSAADKSLEVLDESTFLAKVHTARARVEKMGYVPMRLRRQDKQMAMHTLKPAQKEAPANSRFAASGGEDFSQATNALYNREAARGVNEDEEIFAGEEEVSTASKSQWANKYRPRKPRYFNRVQMGYEWNKYNQTHYDHDNPPPKVVQGYKFNVFYPDLIDTARAPTYRIEREHGRKKGQSFAPAGEEDTCLIRFMSGPPYEDVAFRIVDKEWDYSAKRERGFRSSFDKVSFLKKMHTQLLDLPLIYHCCRVSFNCISNSRR